MNIIRIIAEYGSCFLEIALSLYFFSSFRERRFSYKIIVPAMLGVGLIYGSFVNFFDKGNIIFIVSVLATIGAAFCYKFKWITAIIMALIFSVISGLSELIVMQIITLDGTSFNDAVSEFYVYIGTLFAAKTITFMVTLVIRKKKYKSFQSVTAKNFVWLLMLPCSTVAIAMIFSYTILKYGMNDFWGVILLLALMFLLVSNVMIFYIVDKQYELISTREKLKTSTVLLENQKQYYEDIFKSQQEIRKTRHDLKNIFIALQSALNSNDISQYKNIINRKLNEMEACINLSDDADNMVDSILYSKQKDAQAAGIKLEITKTIDQPVVIDYLDLAVLIANILDNAIEATKNIQGDRTIYFSMLTENDSIIVLAKNPTANKQISENMKTTKKNKKKHGFGLLSIKSVAEKYNGNYFLEYENNQAVATAILNNNIDT